MRRRDGLAAAILGVVVLLGAMAVVVMSAASRADAVRAGQERRFSGWVAGEMAASAISEVRADWARAVQSRLPRQAARQWLSSHARGGLVPGSEVLVKPTLAYQPQRTRELITRQSLPMELSEVTIRPLYFNVAQNAGEVVLSATAFAAADAGARGARVDDDFDAPSSGRPALSRTAHARCFFTVDADGSCRLATLPTQMTVEVP